MGVREYGREFWSTGRSAGGSTGVREGVREYGSTGAREHGSTGVREYGSTGDRSTGVRRAHGRVYGREYGGEGAHAGVREGVREGGGEPCVVRYLAAVVAAHHRRSPGRQMRGIRAEHARMKCEGPWTRVSLAEILVLVGGAIPTAPAVPASTKISAMLKRVQEQFTRECTSHLLHSARPFTLRVSARAGWYVK